MIGLNINDETLDMKVFGLKSDSKGPIYQWMFGSILVRAEFINNPISDYKWSWRIASGQLNWSFDWAECHSAIERELLVIRDSITDAGYI